MSKYKSGSVFGFWDTLSRVVSSSCKKEKCEIVYSEVLKADGDFVKRGCKWVIHAPNMGAANNMIASVNEVIMDPIYKKHGKSPYVIVKAVEGHDVQMGITQATKSEKCMTENIIKKIQRKAENMRDNDSGEEMMQLLADNAISALKKSGCEKVMSVRHTASAYRLNYYHNGERKQVSLGDILIFVHKTQIDFRLNSRRKTRTNRYSAHEPIASFGDASYYPVDALKEE